MIRKVLGGVLIYSFMVYTIIVFGPDYQLQAMSIDPPQSIRSAPVFLLLGAVFWLVYDLIRRMLKIITIPFNFLSMGLVHVGINIGMLYAFSEIVNNMDQGITLTMGSFIEVVILAFLLGIIGLFLKYI